APKHGANRSKDLPELVVQFAGDVAQRGLLSGNKFLGQFAAALRDFLQAGKQTPVPANQRKAAQKNREQGGGQKDVDLAAYAVVDLDDALSGLLFVLAVLNQQTGDRAAQRSLPLLQGILDLLAGIFFFSPAGQSKDAIHGVPKLGERTGQKRALLGSAAAGGESRFQTHSVIQIGADAFELRRPGRQRIRLVAADHVAHGYGEQVQVILDTEQLEG